MEHDGRTSGAGAHIGSHEFGQPLTLLRWTAGLTLLLIVAYGVALWAMATKPV